MAFMEWTEDLRLGIESIDTQHKKLIDLINALDTAIAAGYGNDMLGKVLGGLLDYTIEHFSYEENLLERCDYPSYPSHKAEHDSLTEKVEFLSHVFEQGQSVNTDQIMQFLKIWLQEHILDIDKRYVPFVKEKSRQLSQC